MRRTLSALCALVLVIALALPAGAAPIPLKVATHASDTSALGRSLQSMKQFIEEKSQGKYRVDIYGSFKLGTMESCYQGLQVGTLHFLLEAPSNLSNFIPLFQMFDLGYLFPTTDIADKVLSGPFGRKVLDMAANKTVTPLAFVRYAHRTLWSVKPVTSMADLKGNKMRASSSKVHIAVLKNMGMNPTPMAGSEVYTALQQGALEGMDVDLAYGVNTKWYEACRQLVLTNHAYLPQIFFTSTKWWNGLSAEDKALFDEAVRLLAVEQRKNQLEDDNTSMAEVKANNLGVYIPTQAEQDELARATNDIYKDFPKINVELLNELKAEVARAAAK